VSANSVVIYGFDPVAGTFRPVVTGAAGLLVAEQKANSGELVGIGGNAGYDVPQAIVDDAICGNVQWAFSATIQNSASPQLVGCIDFSTNWATGLRVDALVKSAVGGAGFELQIRSEGYTAPFDRILITNAFVAGVGIYTTANSAISPNIPTVANIDLQALIYPRMSSLVNVPPNSGVTEVNLMYSLLR